MHWTSVAILSLFLFELSLLIYVFRRAFFVGPGSFWLKVDLVVVSVSLVRGQRDPPPPCAVPDPHCPRCCAMT
jgi:hypothetical protein